MANRDEFLAEYEAKMDQLLNGMHDTVDAMARTTSKIQEMSNLSARIKEERDRAADLLKEIRGW